MILGKNVKFDWVYNSQGLHYQHFVSSVVALRAPEKSSQEIDSETLE